MKTSTPRAQPTNTSTVSSPPPFKPPDSHGYPYPPPLSIPGHYHRSHRPVQILRGTTPQNLRIFIPIHNILIHHPPLPLRSRPPLHSHHTLHTFHSTRPLYIRHLHHSQKGFHRENRHQRIFSSIPRARILDSTTAVPSSDNNTWRTCNIFR